MSTARSQDVAEDGQRLNQAVPVVRFGQIGGYVEVSREHIVLLKKLPPTW